MIQGRKTRRFRIGFREESKYDPGEEDKQEKNAISFCQSERWKKPGNKISLLVTVLASMAKSAHVFENVAALDTLVPIASCIVGTSPSMVCCRLRLGLRDCVMFLNIP
jgi:hypothetical protein